MDPRARTTLLLVAIASAAGAAWALRSAETPGHPSSRDASSAAPRAQAPPEAPTPTPIAPPITPTPSQTSQAPAPRPAPIAGKPDPRCPTGAWVDDDFTHDGAGRGCLTAGPDGGLFRDGVWSLRDVDGSIKTGEFVHGVQEGRWSAVYPNGRPAWEASYLHGAPEGLRTDWSPDGAKVAEHFYRDGMLDGQVTITHPDGTVVHEVWRKGVRVDLPSVGLGGASD